MLCSAKQLAKTLTDAMSSAKLLAKEAPPIPIAATKPPAKTIARGELRRSKKAPKSVAMVTTAKHTAGTPDATDCVQ